MTSTPLSTRSQMNGGRKESHPVLALSHNDVSRTREMPKKRGNQAAGRGAASLGGRAGSGWAGRRLAQQR